jgi:hypothetical protein
MSPKFAVVVAMGKGETKFPCPNPKATKKKKGKSWRPIEKNDD